MSCATTLREKGYKLTLQRRLVLDVLHGHEGHLTAEDILEKIETVAPGVDKSTVYRTLELFEQLGLVVKSEHQGKYIYHHAEEGLHHHMVCRVCGKIVQCDTDISEALKKDLLRRFGFEADLKHLVIHGVCGACRKASRQTEK
jgi:Fur family transcriptional regulator, ferric uptake regulator